MHHIHINNFNPIKMIPSESDKQVQKNMKMNLMTRGYFFITCIFVVKLQQCNLLCFQGAYITVSQYKDVTEERAITKLCGYPLCDNRITQVAVKYIFCPYCGILYQSFKCKLKLARA